MGAQWGINRTVAQIHALLFLSAQPLNAEEIADDARRRPVQREQQPARAAGLGHRQGRPHPGRPARSLREHEGRLGDVPHHRRRAQEARGRPDARTCCARRSARRRSRGRPTRTRASGWRTCSQFFELMTQLGRADAQAADAGRDPHGEDGRQGREDARRLTAPFFWKDISVFTEITVRLVASVWLVHGLYNKLLRRLGAAPGDRPVGARPRGRRPANAC